MVLRGVDDDLTAVELLCLGLSLCVCVCLGLGLSLNLRLSLQLSLMLGDSLLLVECQVFTIVWRSIDVSVGVGRNLSNGGLGKVRMIL